LSDSVYGYRYSEGGGARAPRPVKLDSSTSTISVGDFLKLGTAGYYQQAAANEEAQCVAMQASTAPSSDGAKSILADFSTNSVYEFPADTGSAVQGDVGKQCDIGGAQSVNRDASATGAGGDGCLQIVDVDTTANTLFVRLAKPLFAGA
jgi:hypothetical protein